MKMTFDEVLEFLNENLDSIFAAVQLVILALLNRKVQKGSSISPPSAPEVSNVVTPSDKSVSTTPTVSVDKTALKKATRSQLLEDLELFYSDKPDSDFTDAEKQRMQALMDYVQGVTKQ